MAMKEPFHKRCVICHGKVLPLIIDPDGLSSLNKDGMCFYCVEEMN